MCKFVLWTSTTTYLPICYTYPKNKFLFKINIRSSFPMTVLGQSGLLLKTALRPYWQLMIPRCSDVLHTVNVTFSVQRWWRTFCWFFAETFKCKNWLEMHLLRLFKATEKSIKKGFKWANFGLFFVLFRSFLTIFYRKKCKIQLDSNSDRSSRRRARRPLDQNHAPSVNQKFWHFTMKKYRKDPISFNLE